ncbi:chitin synthase [Plakobranchus ocellatus]|uniref:Chitin synthase n=1 Tax=Plakobranchus ocellatus TaxID=259542 RepID=A0AAV4B0J6_9GAST|nr:chitin synthase [Plakobranchus ocellatus]
MVWYQKFEYAVSHWLQKSTEHILGCVLCSPGCFSLFRGSALMDDNVMKRYTSPATEPRHYIQYDQGGCRGERRGKINLRIIIKTCKSTETCAYYAQSVFQGKCFGYPPHKLSLKLHKVYQYQLHCETFAGS